MGEYTVHHSDNNVCILHMDAYMGEYVSLRQQCVCFQDSILDNTGADYAKVFKGDILSSYRQACPLISLR